MTRMEKRVAEALERSLARPDALARRGEPGTTAAKAIAEVMRSIDSGDIFATPVERAVIVDALRKLNR